LDILNGVFDEWTLYTYISVYISRTHHYLWTWWFSQKHLFEIFVWVDFWCLQFWRL